PPRPDPPTRIRPRSTLTSTSNSRTKLTLPNVLHIPRNNPSEQRRTPSSQLRSTRRINRNASALKHPIRRTTLLNQLSNRTTSISHHRTNLRIRLQQRRHIRNKPIHTLTSLIKFHMPQTIITLPSKRNRRPLHIRRNLNPERKPINSNRKLIPSIKPQLRRNHRAGISTIPNA